MLSLFNNFRNSFSEATAFFIPESIMLKIRTEGFQKYFQNTGWPLVAQIINIIVSFFVSTYTIRYLGPERFGVLSFSLSFMGMFSFLSSLIVDGIIYREMIKQPGESNKILGTGFFVKLFCSVLTVILVSTMIFFVQKGDLEVILITIIIAFSLIFQPISIISFYFQSRVMNKIGSMVNVSVLLLLSGLKVYFILNGFGLYWFALIFLLEPIFYGVGYLFFYHRFRESVTNWIFDKKLAIQMIGDSWPLLISAIFATIGGRIDQVFLGKMIDNQSVGLYATMVKLSEAWFFLPGIIAGSLFPAIMNAKAVSDELFKKRLIKLYSLIIWVAIIATGLMFAMSGFLIKLLFGPEFLPVVGPMKAYVFCGIAVAVSMVINQWLLIENFTKIALLCSVIGGVSNILLNLYFIPIYGIMGAVIASLISYFLTIFAILLFKKTRSHWRIIARGLIFKF